VDANSSGRTSPLKRENVCVHGGSGRRLPECDGADGVWAGAGCCCHTESMGVPKQSLPKWSSSTGRPFRLSVCLRPSTPPARTAGSDFGRRAAADARSADAAVGPSQRPRGNGRSETRSEPGCAPSPCRGQSGTRPLTQRDSPSRRFNHLGHIWPGRPSIHGEPAKAYPPSMVPKMHFVA